MKKIILLLYALLCYNAQSQVITDTILYAWEECDTPTGNPQDINFLLDNDSLWIRGNIITNCCGVHFLIYKIFTDTIILTRLDTGYLCDCKCLFKLDMKIGKCSADSFRVILTEYYGHYAIDTLIKKNQVGITYFGQNDMVSSCIPNPFSKNATIHFPNPKSENYSFILFDYTGIKVRIINNITSGKLVIEKGNLEKGLYFYQIVNSNNEGKIYTGKIIIK
ncbi:MAG: T9SS type A sorting domain-containing protein [Bacteroidales bacterium]|nr:T9SS type A sorting domain-containing protein [Bacteroidales bacterium]